MATGQYLAMTAAEIAENPSFSRGICWMACHFSPDGKGLTDLPPQLPEGAVLSLNDSIPIAGHDTDTVARQLEEALRKNRCTALLLDFQRQGNEEAAALAEYLIRVLPCPVIVSEPYAQDLTAPVFLSPAAPSVPLRAHFARWQGREIWLELGMDGEEILLTQKGSAVTPLPRLLPMGDGHRDEKLHCHYAIEQVPDGFRFTLWRTWEDLQALTQEAEALGVVGTIGLYQELSRFCRAGK